MRFVCIASSRLIVCDILSILFIDSGVTVLTILCNAPIPLLQAVYFSPHLYSPTLAIFVYITA
jgi:hypothetical protein